VQTSVVEKGGAGFEGLTMLLCENPLPPIPEAIAAAEAELAWSNLYTEPFSAPLRELVAEREGVPVELVHVNAGSELILRQLLTRMGARPHLVLPTYPLFPELCPIRTETLLEPDEGFALDLRRVAPPAGTTLVVLVNPNNPNGTAFDVEPLPELLARFPDTYFLVDEAFIGLSGTTVAPWVRDHENLLVTRTLSKAHSLAGFRVGYAIVPRPIADAMNRGNDAYPLARVSQAAAIATLEHEDEIRRRVGELKTWARELAAGIDALGFRTFPTETYFFLTDLAPLRADRVASSLRERGILVKPLGDPRLGPGYLRITTSTPDGNRRFLAALADVTRR
jgi:histidinol-phosphate aminotransferase